LRIERVTRRRAFAVIVLATATLLAVPGRAEARDAIVRSFDGTPISVHFFPATGLGKGKRAPLVMLAHGFGEKGPSDPEGPRLAGAVTVSRLLKAGYNVLTWDARGHGDSGGTAMIDSPEFEVRDTRALIDWAARQPEVLLDAPGDPRVGMNGASYGGIIQFLTAAADRRVDVITPAYTANSIPYAAAPDGAFKQSWAAFLLAVTAENVPSGVTSPAGPQVHGVDPVWTTGGLEGLATGRLSDTFERYLWERSPARVLSRVRVPTLLQQGTPDNLFSLFHAIRTFTALEHRGVPVKMTWNCEGHSICFTNTGPLGHFDAVAIQWFDRWLKRDRRVDTESAFE
jgi:ABC-2 type transport system ATP-binding protein